MSLIDSQVKAKILLNTLDATSKQIAVAACTLNVVDFKREIALLGLLTIDEPGLEDSEVIIAGNRTTKRVGLSIPQDPWSVSKQIAIALSGIGSISIYQGVNREIDQILKARRKELKTRSTSSPSSTNSGTNHV